MKLVNSLSRLTMISSLTMGAVSLLRSSVYGFGPSFSRYGPNVSARTNNTQRKLFEMFGSATAKNSKYPIIAEEEVMSQKGHGTSEKPVQKNLRWNCDYETADRICNFNRHYAEFAGYWESTEFLTSVKNGVDEPIKFYDSVTGALLFKAPVGRSMEDFVKESRSHGWPSFRDEEVSWDHVRCLTNGECISETGTHLGHNLPDRSGNRYCINLVSVAGQPEEEK